MPEHPRLHSKDAANRCDEVTPAASDGDRRQLMPDGVASHYRQLEVTLRHSRLNKSVFNDNLPFGAISSIILNWRDVDESVNLTRTMNLLHDGSHDRRLAILM